MKEASNIKDLWGDLPVETIRTPYVVLKEQASIFTKKTNGLLIGEVTKEEFEESIFSPPRQATTIEHLKELKQRHFEENKYDFTSTLEIVVPSMNDYSISIVQIDYPIEMYPLRIMNTVTDSYCYEKCKDEVQLNRAKAY